MWPAVGITEIEQRVYAAFLRDPDIDPADGGTFGLPAPRYRAAVRRLVAAGLLEAGPADDQPPRPVDPRVAVGALIRGRQDELDKLAAHVDTLATEFYHRRLLSDPQQVIRVVEGREAISAEFRGIVQGAERDIVGLEAPPRVMSFDDCTVSELAALRRRVTFRSVYGTEVLTDREMVEHVTTMVAAGEKARLLASVPLKLLIVDHTTAILPLTASETGTRFRAVVVARSALTDALYALFELLWRQATPWPVDGAGEAVPAGGLTEAESLVLRCLVAGVKDEVIARRLGCSRRTLQRRIDTLLDRLGATSRFQAGVRAAQRGWL